MFWAQNREQTTKNCFLVTVNEEHFLKFHVVPGVGNFRHIYTIRSLASLQAL